MPGGFVVRDANGQALTYLTPATTRTRRGRLRVLTKDEARRIAGNIARLPELLGKADRDCTPAHCVHELRDRRARGFRCAGCLAGTSTHSCGPTDLVGAPGALHA
jgi:hypothetical protein